MSQRRIVVVTGGSAGVGRAIVREFAEHGYDVAILARGEAGLKAAAADVAAARRPGAAARVRCVVAGRGRGRCETCRGRARSDRRLGQRRVRRRTALLLGHQRRALPADHRRDLHGLRQRHPRRADADAPARPGCRRTGRVGARTSRHPAAVGVLRGEARDPRIHRVGHHRADPRAQQGPGLHGRPARRQHAAVRLERQRVRRAPDAGAADLPAGGAGPDGALRRRASAAERLGRLPDGQDDPRQPGRAVVPRLVPRATRSCRASSAQRRTATRAPTRSSRRTRRPTPAHTACSTTRRAAATRGHGPRCTAARSVPARSWRP